MQMNRVDQFGILPTVNPVNSTPAETAESFSTYLSNALNEVNNAQVESAKLADKFAAGQIEDLHQVMIAGQQATILLQLTTQIRNKVIESYQEIMRMPL